MFKWLTLSFTILFVFLAYDSFRLVGKRDSTSSENELTDEAGASLVDIKRRRHWNVQYGVGNLNGIVLLFLILAIGSGFATAIAFLVSK